MGLYLWFWFGSLVFVEWSLNLVILGFLVWDSCDLIACICLCFLSTRFDVGFSILGLVFLFYLLN